MYYIGKHMQTFLPYPDFYKSLSCLDPQRLGNQVYNEGLLLLRGGWQFHPASRMWQGHFYSLAEYLLVGIRVLLEERGRDYRYHVPEILHLQSYHTRVHLPPWVGNDGFHRAHRSNLVRKKPEWYGPLFEPYLPDDLPYIWPVP